MPPATKSRTTFCPAAAVPSVPIDRLSAMRVRPQNAPSRTPVNITWRLGDGVIENFVSDEVRVVSNRAVIKTPPTFGSFAIRRLCPLSSTQPPAT
jgi:hypothetical protein